MEYTDDKYLWSFHCDYGRMGDLYGLIVATESEIDGLDGVSVHFGEILGKHSEVYGELERSDFTKKDVDSESVTKLHAVLGDCWSGYDPRQYLAEDRE